MGCYHGSLLWESVRTSGDVADSQFTFTNWQVKHLVSVGSRYGGLTTDVGSTSWLLAPRLQSAVWVSEPVITALCQLDWTGFHMGWAARTGQSRASVRPGPVFSYKLRYIVGFWLVEMAISTSQKPTIYRNLYENTGPGALRWLRLVNIITTPTRQSCQEQPSLHSAANHSTRDKRWPNIFSFGWEINEAWDWDLTLFCGVTLDTWLVHSVHWEAHRGKLFGLFVIKRLVHHIDQVCINYEFNLLDNVGAVAKTGDVQRRTKGTTITRRAQRAEGLKWPFWGEKSKVRWGQVTSPFNFLCCPSSLQLYLHFTLKRWMFTKCWHFKIFCETRAH